MCAQSQCQIPVVEALRRTKDICSAHEGGPRNPAVHEASLEVLHADQLEGKHVLLIDDVCTSVSTMWGCQRVLRRSNIDGITCMAIGRTCQSKQAHDQCF